MLQTWGSEALALRPTHAKKIVISVVVETATVAIVYVRSADASQPLSALETRRRQPLTVGVIVPCLLT